MKNTILLAAIICFVALSFSNSNAQTTQSIGKVFDKDLANAVFGKIYFSHPLSKGIMKKILADTTGLVYFNVAKNKFKIFNKNKKPLDSDTSQPVDGETYYVFSNDKIKELVDRSKDSTNVQLEMRGSHITLTSGDITLENSWICPPVCP